MAKLVLTSNFKTPCLLCNCMPVDETSEVRRPLTMIHAVGVDVNWGEDANICQICAGVMADMLGRPDALKVQRLANAKQELAEQLEALTEKHTAMTERIRKMVAGRKAEKEQREELA